MEPTIRPQEVFAAMAQLQEPQRPNATPASIKYRALGLTLIKYILVLEEAERHREQATAPLREAAQRFADNIGQLRRGQTVEGEWFNQLQADLSVLIKALAAHPTKAESLEVDKQIIVSDQPRRVRTHCEKCRLPLACGFKVCMCERAAKEAGQEQSHG